MKPCAFFDMDRTLIRCNSATRWILFLRRRKEISHLGMLRALGWLAQYKLSILDIEAVTTKVMADMHGQPEQALIEKTRVFFASEVAHEVTDAGRRAIAWHRDRGHEIALLTSSTRYVPEQLAISLGIEHVLCTHLGVEGGQFDGNYRRPACYGAGKVHWAEEFAKTHRIDLSKSYFYTDSYSDLPMLERVGEKRVVNPDLRLSRHARRAGWEVQSW
jgi:HAD superfamily hydrolase (TIGR01490 family)